MNRKLPFVGRIFWKVLVVVAVLVVVGWFLIIRLTSYEITSADYGGSTVSGLILAYLIHLWLLPHGEPSPEGEMASSEAEGEDPPSQEQQQPVNGE